MAGGPVLRHLRFGPVLVGLALIAPFITIAPAHADLRVCNETGNQVSVALGYRAERGWQSEGWWVASPDNCATVYRGDLNARYFYLYVADDIGGGAWDGQVYMCTRDESFTIFGVEDCLARGYERTGFFEVDTQNRTDWTLQLTEPGGTQADPGAAGEDNETQPLDEIGDPDGPGPGGPPDGAVEPGDGPDIDAPPDGGDPSGDGPDQSEGDNRSPA